MEKAIDIKRRAQRCLQSGDLDGALGEYEKLTRLDEPEPIHFVLLADLLFKKGNPLEAGQRYLQSVDAYTAAGLYKNAIAVCKKMARLALSPTIVLQRLAELHVLDGLGTEAALYYQELSEIQAREKHLAAAADSLRKAFELSPENPKLLERAGEWRAEAGDAPGAAESLIEAARAYERRGQDDDATRARERAKEIDPGGELMRKAAPPGEGARPPNGPAEVEDFDPAAAFAPAEGLESRRSFEAPAAPLPADGFAPPGDRVEAPGDHAEAVPASEREEPLGASPLVSDVTPAPPAGLRFPPDPEPAAAPDLAAVEELLRTASERYRNGEREAAGEALIEAARAYETLDRLESAATIYRSLGRMAHAAPEVLGLWLRNCELRGDHAEAAEVACTIGDRTLNDDDPAGARAWFERAIEHVPGHELARRRLDRLQSAPAAPARPNGAAPDGAPKDGRVEVAVGRAQAVTFDLGALISEFQRGLESQLSGDAQSHYDLGMTYREMGLFDQAVECFRGAAQDDAFAMRAGEMIGRCLLDQGRIDEAAEEFARALERHGDDGEAGVCLRFQLGLAHEVAGRTPEALAEFERVYALQPTYPDVAQKIRVLRRATESV